MGNRILGFVKKVGRHTKAASLGVRNLVFRHANGVIRPTHIWFETVDKCNSRCVHCNIWQKTFIKNPLTPQEIEKIFKDDLFKDVGTIVCSGGEPSARPDLKEVILSLHRALPEANIQVGTNALLPDRIIEVTKAALEAGINFFVGVSMDGIGEDHDKIRGVKGNYDKADRLIRALVELRKGNEDRLHITVSLVLFDPTSNAVSDVRAYAKALDVEIIEAWYNQSSFYENVGLNDPKDHMRAHVESQEDSPLKDLWLKHLDGKSIQFPCLALQKFCIVKCNGDIVPCLTHWDEKMGNIRDASPTKVWCDKSAKKARCTVKSCKGCLNSWGAGWSLEGLYFPKLAFYLKRPKLLWEKMQKA